MELVERQVKRRGRRSSLTPEQLQSIQRFRVQVNEFLYFGEKPNWDYKDLIHSFAEALLMAICIYGMMILMIGLAPSNYPM